LVDLVQMPTAWSFSDDNGHTPSDVCYNRHVMPSLG
jgi:hypothetical protein